MIGYLCASKQNDRCKAPNWECKDDLVCDASNQPEDGVCISPELADKRSEFDEITLENGKRIIGNKTAIKKLRESFKTQPVVRPASPRVPTNYTDCYGDYTYEKLNEMSVPKILTEFFGPGKLKLTGRPKNKGELIAYLCSIGQERRCTDPNWDCEDGYICDASNDPGVCMPEQFGEKENLDKRKFASMMFKGKKIIGTKTSISKLKKKLENADNTPQDDVPAPSEPSTQKSRHTDCYGDYTYEKLEKMSLSKIVEKLSMHY
jgi:ribosomal protein L30E